MKPTVLAVPGLQSNTVYTQGAISLDAAGNATAQVDLSRGQPCLALHTDGQFYPATYGRRRSSGLHRITWVEGGERAETSAVRLSIASAGIEQAKGRPRPTWRPYANDAQPSAGDTVKVHQAGHPQHGKTGVIDRTDRHGNAVVAFRDGSTGGFHHTQLKCQEMASAAVEQAAWKEGANPALDGLIHEHGFTSGSASHEHMGGGTRNPIDMATMDAHMRKHGFTKAWDKPHDTLYTHSCGANALCFKSRSGKAAHVTFSKSNRAGASLDEVSLERGAPCLALWEGDGQMHPATFERRRSTGTFKVRWQEGGERAEVSAVQPVD